MKTASAIKTICYCMAVCLLLLSCHSKDNAAASEDAPVASQTPVTVTTINDSTLTDYIDLNATSTTLRKNYIKSNTNGYIKQVNAVLGHDVSKGEVLFTIKTREAEAIGSSINILDTTFKFSGVNKIRASAPGFISAVSHQKGDYVQDGDPLAVISDRSSLVFLMQLPYELKRYVKQGQTVNLTLPGDIKINGTVASFMPQVDTISQTQGVVIRFSSMQQVPENLVAKARIIKSVVANTPTLPKAAILSNETQTEYWVMKLINPTTAVKVPVKEGIQAGDRVAILSPRFSPGDKIVLTGNYGLGDTAKVKVIK